MRKLLLSIVIRNQLPEYDSRKKAISPNPQPEPRVNRSQNRAGARRGT